MPHDDAVPARMHLAPDTLDRRVLDQTRYWVTASADVVRLSSMSRDHLVAVLGFLHERHATRPHLEAMIDALVDLVDADHAGTPTGEQATQRLVARVVFLAPVEGDEGRQFSPVAGASHYSKITRAR